MEGTLDSTFDTFSKGVNRLVRSTAIQSDGKVLLGGDFTSLDGQYQNRLARLTVDGLPDTSFTIGTGANSTVWCIAVQSDGKILIGGDFSSYNGQSRNYITRLNADGSLDETFNVGGSNANSLVLSIAIQDDKKILIGGLFTRYNGQTRNCIARLNENGTLDMSFGGSGTNNLIRSIVIQGDRKILIGGDFTSYGGQPQNYIALLNTDGSLNTSFNSGCSGIVRSIAIQGGDGKIIIGGDFGTYNATSRNCIARLNANGSLDNDFISSTNTTVWSVAIQSDGKILIGGDFTTYNGVLQNRIARINTDGSLDTLFNVGGTGANNSVQSVKVQTDGTIEKIIIAGDFPFYNGATKNRIARLNTDGLLDRSYGRDLTYLNGTVWSMAVQSDRKIVVGGNFTKYNNLPKNHIVRLNADATLDESFTASANNIIYSTVIQPDGRILIGGDFTIPRGYIARLNADGSLDDSFLTSSNGTVWYMFLLGSGKILIGGFFTSYGGQTQRYIARLNENGSLDTSFNVDGSGANNVIRYITAHGDDGKIIIAGDFTTYNGISQARIARLNSDGSLDTTTFNVGGAGANGSIRSIAVLRDGKILIGGDFTTYNQTPINRIARLNADGSLDTSFNPGGSGADGFVLSMAVQPNEKIIIGGSFTNYNGVRQTRITRLNADGSLDISFNSGGSGANVEILSIAIQNDKKILIGGGFTIYNGIGVSYIIRLIGFTPPVRHIRGGGMRISATGFRMV